MRTVVSGALSVGTHRLIWDGRDDLGREVATGLYLVQLSDRQRSVVQKITLLRLGEDVDSTQVFSYTLSNKKEQ